VSDGKPPERCILCDSPHFLGSSPINDGWSMYICSDCETGTTSPVPTAVQAAQVNVDRYPLDETIATYLSRMREFRARWAQLLRYLPRRPNSILDVGCSAGFFLDYASTQGIPRCAGVEINEALRSWGRTTLGLDIRPTIDDFRDEEFDAVLFQDSLEHIASPIAALSLAGTRTSEDGVVFVQLPNRRSQMARVAGTRWPWFSAPDHLMHLTPRGIEVAAKRCGLSILSVRTCDARVDLLETLYPWLFPGHLRRLRTFPGFGQFWVRHGAKGGLIQAIMRPPARG